LWNFFSQSHTLEEGVDALCGEYNVEKDVAETDVKRFLDVLQRDGFIE